MRKKQGNQNKNDKDVWIEVDLAWLLDNPAFKKYVEFIC
jgi:hypothetical protein